MQLRVPDSLGPGTTVKCPQCGGTFAVPAPSAPLPPLEPGQFTGGSQGAPPSRPTYSSGTEQDFASPDQLRRPFDPMRGGMEREPGDYRLDLAVICNQANPNYA